MKSRKNVAEVSGHLVLNDAVENKQFHIKSAPCRYLSFLKLLLSQVKQDVICQICLIFSLCICGTRVKAAALEVLSNVFLVLVSLLLPELSNFVLQLDNGPLNFIVLADQ